MIPDCKHGSKVTNSQPGSSWLRPSCSISARKPRRPKSSTVSTSRRPPDFGRNCLLARRMIERGVRFVQVWSGAGGAAGNWDNHGNIAKELAFIAGQMDQPTAGAARRSAKSRPARRHAGDLDDRVRPHALQPGTATGRDHNGGTFVSWFAGAGSSRASLTARATNGPGKPPRMRPTCYDFHATILHLLGIDHERLTFHHNGINRRLTDVHGKVIQEVLA